ncbi:MAG: Na+/H+ antiporter NhaA [Deltaproteobacteria bacterium]|nr:Na+/H+ antiporter NhaA [Deltaproteobacteria bacterium]
MTALALLWVNSPLGPTYEQLWRAPISLGVGAHRWALPARLWVNDVLMTLFFLAVGLELRRELAQGVLASVRRAALPVSAAAGGMVAPALIFYLCNRGLPGAPGWAIPTATDIAFSLSLFTVIAPRAPPTLRALLVSIATLDDLGAVAVIAAFYGRPLGWPGLLISLAGVALVGVLRRHDVRRASAYALPGALLWVGFHDAGVHPSLAGVSLGLLMSVEPGVKLDALARIAQDACDDLKVQAKQGAYLDPGSTPALELLVAARREAISPVARLEEALRPVVGLVVLPLFALANAGVALGGSEPLAAGPRRVVAGTVVGLVVGKPLGIVLASALVVRLRLTTLPAGASWWGVVQVGVFGGVGFTISLFFAELAFPPGPLLDAARLGVLAAALLVIAVAVVARTVGWYRREPRAR